MASQNISTNNSPMNIFKKALLVLLASIILISCSELREVYTSNLKIGMTKSEVQTVLKKKPAAIIAAKNFPEVHTIVEVVSYVGTGGGYFLYFVNNRLQKWTPNDERLLYLDDMLPNQTGIN